MIALGVNIDHVATLRQARYRGMEEAFNAEPSPIEAAVLAERAGAAGITAHLREDRRHMQDADIFALRGAIATKLNFEMGNSPDILAIALQVRPADACLVPENRNEVTTEGGLDCVTNASALAPTIAALQGVGTRVSLFIDPEVVQIHEAARLGVEFIELHTGAFANAQDAAADSALQRLVTGAELAHSLGLRVNAGHGINYVNVLRVLEIPHLEELNIGHSIIARSLTVGIENAVQEMLALMKK